MTEQIRKGARSVPSTSAINSLGLNGRYNLAAMISKPNHRPNTLSFVPQASV